MARRLGFLLILGAEASCGQAEVKSAERPRLGPRRPARRNSRERPKNVDLSEHMAVGQNQWYHFGGAPPILVYFSGDWDVHWGYDSAFDPWPYVG